MATLTFTPISQTAADRTEPVKPGFFTRLLNAVIASNRRRAEIELRRHLTLIGEPRERMDYALLPFRGE